MNREAANWQALRWTSDALRSCGSPSAGLEAIRGSVRLMASVRPAWSVQLVKLNGMLHKFLLDVGRCSEAASVLEAILDLRSCQREELWREALAVPTTTESAVDPWCRRLVQALRLFEPTPEALQHGRKRRVGGREDGGYVVWDSGGLLCDVLLSYGIGTNVDFEVELAEKGVRVFSFDHTVPGLPRPHQCISFSREALSGNDVLGIAGTLQTHLCVVSAMQRVVLKMDVEGAEFGAILATPQETLDRFDQICVEFHWLGRPWRDGNFKSKALALERLNKHFVLLHVHGNRYGDVMDLAGCSVPDVLEALYVHRRVIGTQFRKSSTGIPSSELDCNNCAFLPDIALSGVREKVDGAPRGHVDSSRGTLVQHPYL